MGTKEDALFVLELMDFVFQVTGKPLPCNLQRKLDKYTKKEESNLTLNIRRAAMIYINDRLVSDEIEVSVASKIYESLMKKLLKKYTPGEFLKFLSYFAYGSVLEYINHKPDSPDIYFTSVVRFIENLRKKGRICVDFWKNLDQFSITLVEEDSNRNNYKTLRKTEADIDMSAEKGFVLKIMYLVFDSYCRDLPQYLQMELDDYRMISPYDPNIKNAVFVMLNEVGKKSKLLGGMEPIVLHYHNLSTMHFSQKYFLEFCVSGSKKALIEYINDSKEHSPRRAYELLVYILLLAKEDGKYSSLEEMNDAASKILEEDRDRIEHERARNSYIEDSSGSIQQPRESDLIGTSRQTSKDCTCCTLN